MSKTLYLECYSGISGDMTVAALLDLGVDKNKLLETLKDLEINEEFSIKISKVNKCGIEANDFDVILKEHTHEYEHHNHHHHEHRNLEDVFNIIDKLKDEKVKNLSKKIFNIVATSEAKAHGTEVKDVHFHEVGAVDSIIDIISAAFCLVELDIMDVIVSKIYEGKGFIKCAHGIMPVPVPAVLNIISDNNIEIFITDNEGEMITPTGAAIVAAIKTKDKLPENYTIKKVGLGAGKRYPDRPNMVRAMIIEEKI
jgi:uncharacterized protein (TIGR00299 family) protein